MTQTLEIRPIGYVVGGRSEVSDDQWSGTAVIRLNPEFPAEVVQGLAEFSHLLVVWHFHRASPADVALHARSPRNDPRWPATGTFVHRNHRRPNQLAQSFPRLLKVDGLNLHVTDLDAVDGSPVYDLAPYFREMGPRGPIRQPAWPGEMLTDYWAEPPS
ncbi:SAM-dependent methyltransferase [Streptomyces tsukubensis]|uniref:Transcriptional regulator n=1 Tax=Streptomyces tsukubensis (strain DSM 42081 / NBRC 108919 / NRRL 18488 / 9993) TaxID=1114943 RepID=A0A7G3UDR7_STRT9|nr:SAM-dependent methyltransferase [Streptomyces tsukubensis]AZK95387.1 transcriptional regulator [Streptomyces tsukubensis]QKM68563.1 transcriptional regulator [Streptomyces tsukubensis NRRL18488]TAI43371.1 S-adenosylmethionine-dependent methyltransferase [Streptomyces tsukubensis]